MDGLGALVRITLDGQPYEGSYREIAEHVQQAARDDAGGRHEPSARKAKAAARRQTAGIAKRLRIEQALPLDAPQEAVADSMLRDLRDVYSRSLIAALTAPNKKQIEDENMKAIEAALELL